jgi:hypothetical protein
MKKALIIFLPLLILSFIVFYLVINQNHPQEDNFQNEKENIGSSDSLPPNPIEQTENPSTETEPKYSPETSSSNENADGTASGDESSETQTSSSTDSCEKEVSYSLKDSSTQEECLSLEGEVCLTKKVTCSLNVKNLDSATSGNFKIKTNFLDNSDNLLFSTSSSIFVEAQTTERLEVIHEFNGEDANKRIVCAFRTESIPKRTC